MKYIVEPTVTVITPTLGKHHILYDAVCSVGAQDYKNVKHLLVYDGKNESGIIYNGVDVCTLPYNTGGDGFYGHRIFAAFSHLINTDFVCFLDEDNWFEPNHVSSLVQSFDTSIAFAHSLRKIYTLQKEFVCEDNCEALGEHHVFHSESQHLVDTSSYMFRTQFLRQAGHLWDHGWGADRRFFHAVKDQVKYTCSGQYTLCYRLSGNANSVSADFFKQGNEAMQRKYGDKFPWRK